MQIQNGNVSVRIGTETAADLAQRCVECIMYVSDNAHPAIRAQAKAYQKEMQTIIEDFIRVGMENERKRMLGKDKG